MKTTAEKIESRLLDIVTTQLSVERAEVSLDSSFASLGADSLDATILIMEIEEAFDVPVPLEDEGKFVTVQDALTYVLSKGGKTL